jgi:hypothetical protein
MRKSGTAVEQADDVENFEFLFLKFCLRFFLLLFSSLMACFNHSISSDDDFETSKSPLLSQNYVKKNLKIPVGHILAAMKWKNTRVAQKMIGSFY